MEHHWVLLADDDDGWLKTLESLFKELGCTIDTAGNYVDTRKLLDSRVYQLIVCDKGMPLGGERKPDPTCGLQLLAWAKGPHSHNKNTPFVLHTADGSEEVQATVNKFGGLYLLKGDHEYDFFKSLLSKIV